MAEATVLARIMPELPLDDVPPGVAYYRDVLGFTVKWGLREFLVLDAEGNRITFGQPFM